MVRTGFTVDRVAALLGPAARAALDRGETTPARRAIRDAGDAGTLIRLFLLGDPVPRDEVAAALEPADVDEAVSAGLLADRDGQVSAALDLRPHGDAAVPDAAPWWVLSDLEVDPAGRTADREHVLGTGAASLSLARATVRRPVDTLLDVGTGCGVQVLHCSGHARRMTATDVSARALDMARVTLALSGVDAELLDGPWLEPVAGRRFDQIVSNPPFVPGPPQVDHVYRDSGLGGDGASALLVGRLPGFLTEGGVAQLLASWLITSDDWTDRPRTWLAEAADAAAPDGLDAWVVQRDVADPGLHVGTWLRDAGVDPASPEGTALSERWLDFLAGEGVHAIGFGFVTLRRTAPDVAGTVVCEDLRQSHDDPLGPEIEGWLDRTAWLARHPGDALLDTRPRVPDTVALERGLVPTDEGWSEVAATLVRLDGPQWRHDVDELGAALLAGCRGYLPLRDLLELLALAHGRDADELAEATLPVVRDLVRHGMLECG
ncbi:methyltransferase [Actinomycetospora callitridis]|nr:methyltransferase [Actinomycetospora callitridis]MDD7917150.1 methyltransferase [Actinomycetospora callitridis]